jgi:hypothetical protein
LRVKFDQQFDLLVKSRALAGQIPGACGSNSGRFRNKFRALAHTRARARADTGSHGIPKARHRCRAACAGGAFGEGGQRAVLHGWGKVFDQHLSGIDQYLLLTSI